MVACAKKQFFQETPMTNLLVTMLDKVGVRSEKLGDSTQPLDLEPAFA